MSTKEAPLSRMRTFVLVAGLIGEGRGEGQALCLAGQRCELGRGVATYVGVASAPGISEQHRILERVAALTRVASTSKPPW